KTKRAVPVPAYGGLVGQAACGIVVAAPALHRWVTHGLRVLETHALDGIVGAGPDAGVQRVGNRARLAGGISREDPERGPPDVTPVVVVLVAANREIRQRRLRQAAPVGNFLRRFGVADVFGFAYEQRVDHL